MYWAVYPMCRRFWTGYKLLTSLIYETMKNNFQPLKSLYTETEAADFLGISLTRLHMILDQNLFNDGSERPANVTFQASDLVLLRFWNRTMPNPKVVRMPKRYR